jgi:hypothetical protein
MLELAGLLEAAEIARQRRHGTNRSLVTSSADLDPASVRLLALTWWPAGLGALAAAAWLPRLDLGPRWRGHCLAAGAAVTGAGIAELTATLPGYREYIRPRLIPHIW